MQRLSSPRKTDNANMPFKLGIRRYFLDKYHQLDLPNVFDACQGDRLLWSNLEREYELAGYWGVDKRFRRGRIKIDSRRILEQSGWPQNVIDIDVYGGPWGHWFALLPNVERPTTVFLTMGTAGKNGHMTRLERVALDALGMGTIQSITRITVLNRPLIPMSIPYCLAAARNYGLEIVEAAEASVTDYEYRTRYIGVRLNRIQPNDQR